MFTVLGGVAEALPGQPFGTVVASMRARHFNVQIGRSELSATATLVAKTSYRGLMVRFGTVADDRGRSYREALSWTGNMLFRPGDQTARGVLTTLYDPWVAADFGAAKFAGAIPVFQEPVPSRYYRGRRFGYVARPGSLELWPASRFDQVMRDARACAHVSCGD